MVIRKIDVEEFKQILVKEGVLVFGIIMDSGKLISLCHTYGFYPNDVV